MKLDLAIRLATGIEIIDWKTGQETGWGPNTLQLAVYALNAAFKRDHPAEQIRLREVNLAHGAESVRQLDENTLRGAAISIVDSAEEMRKYLADRAENIPVEEEHFPRGSRERKCSGCNFIGRCLGATGV